MTGRAAFVALAAALAVGCRLIDVTEWPSHYYPTLDYESALAARTVRLLVTPPDARPADDAAWLATAGTRHVTSPPILPALVAACGEVAGREVPWAAKVFNAAFWLAAGAFAGSAVVRMTGSGWAGATAFAWLALDPFGLLVARVFQADSLLVCAFAYAVRHLATPRPLTWRATLTSAAVCGAAAFVKPGVLLAPLGCGFAAGVLPAAGGRGRKAAHLAAFALVAAAPSLLYAALMLTGHVGAKLAPRLLLDGRFYPAVAAQLWHAVGGGGVALLLLGAVVAARRGVWLPLGLAAGHVAFCGLFTFHCATHDYYHAPLLVTAAVGAGWCTAWLEPRLAPWLAARRSRRAGFAAALVLALLALPLARRHPDVGPWRWGTSARSKRAAEDARRADTADKLRAVRAVVPAGSRVVERTDDFGYPLQFHAKVDAVRWPTAGDAAFPATAAPPADLRTLAADTGASFFVLTDRAAFDRDPELRAALDRHGPPKEPAAGVWVWNLYGGR